MCFLVVDLLAPKKIVQLFFQPRFHWFTDIVYFICSFITSNGVSFALLNANKILCFFKKDPAKRTRSSALRWPSISQVELKSTLTLTYVWDDLITKRSSMHFCIYIVGRSLGRHWVGHERDCIGMVLLPVCLFVLFCNSRACFAAQGLSKWNLTCQTCSYQFTFPFGKGLHVSY